MLGVLGDVSRHFSISILSADIQYFSSPVLEMKQTASVLLVPKFPVSPHEEGAQLWQEGLGQGCSLGAELPKWLSSLETAPGDRFHLGSAFVRAWCCAW